MRDPKRIRDFCNRLCAAWTQCPDLRFGQLVCNTFTSLFSEPFYTEDDDMIKKIEERAKVLAESYCTARENQNE